MESKETPLCRFCGERRVDPARLARNPNVKACEQCLAKRATTGKVEMEIPLLKQKV